MKPQPLLLLFPPTNTPLAYPHLGIPSLVAYLHAHGYTRVDHLDLNAHYRSGFPNTHASRIGRRRPPPVRKPQHDRHDLLRSFRAISSTLPPTLADFASTLSTSGAPRAIGMSLVYPGQVPSSLALVQLLKERNPHLLLIAGGPMVTVGAQRYIRGEEFIHFDALVVGDGEEPLLQLVSQIDSGTIALHKLSNCYYKQNNSFAFSGRTYICRPEEYRTPVFPPSAYSKLPLRISKGCYWRKCSFCTYRTIFDGYIPGRVDRAVRHIMKLQAKYGVREFILVDDAVPPKVLEDLSRRLIGANVDIEWVCSAIFDKKFQDPDVAKALFEAGCKTIFFGFESANERILTLMGKPNKRKAILAILTNLTTHGVWPHLNVMIGFPTEETHEAQETIRFLKKHKNLYGNFSLQKFSLEEYSEVYNAPERFGIRSIKQTAERNISDRIGLEFETERGMNAKQRHYMAMKGRLAYRRQSISRLGYLKGKLECAKYAALNLRDIIRG